MILEYPYFRKPPFIKYHPQNPLGGSPHLVNGFRTPVTTGLTLLIRSPTAYGTDDLGYNPRSTRGEPPSMVSTFNNSEAPAIEFPSASYTLKMCPAKGRGPKMRSDLLQRICAEINQRARIHQEFL